ncbi:MAG TPA: hypothetical protein VGK00_03235 [Anaerolineales bacterium]|jgi:hypothetical protein
MKGKLTQEFRMRISPEDAKNFEELAKELSRNKSDALRFMAGLWVEKLKSDRSGRPEFTNDKPTFFHM